MRLSINLELEKDVNFKLDIDLISGIMTTTDNEGLINQEKIDVNNAAKFASIFIQRPIQEFLED